MRHTHPFAALGLLVGTTIGAGMFALPYVSASAGLGVALAYLVFFFLAFALLNMLYGEAIYVIPGKHRLPGYARLVLGRYGEQAAIWSMVFGYFGAMLAYGILGGSFLAMLFGGYAPAIYSIGFFVVGSLLLFLNLEEIGWINFLLTVPLVAFVFILAAVTIPGSAFPPVPWIGTGSWFAPYGVFLFALAGFSIVPEVVEMLMKREGRVFERIIIIGGLVPALVYALFVFGVLGALDGAVLENPIDGLSVALGNLGVRLAGAIGFLAVATSYLAIGVDLESAFRLDYKMSRSRSWLLVAVFPLLFFLFGAQNYVGVIEVVGSIMFGMIAIVILLLAFYARKHHHHPKGFLPIGKIIPLVLIVIFVLGIILELVRIIPPVLFS